jgi:hypothetical protein
MVQKRHLIETRGDEDDRKFLPDGMKKRREPELAIVLPLSPVEAPYRNLKSS